MAKPFWVSWWAAEAFVLAAPWWVSGQRDDDAESICAAVMADDEEGARAAIREAQRGPGEPEWRFCDEKPAEWSPFSDRFPRAEHHVWPWPEAA